jgi:IS4 transposase
MILPPKPRQPHQPDSVEKLEQLLQEPVFSEIPLALVPHAEAVPLGVMVRGTMEWLLDKPTLELLFQNHAPNNYTRELTITALVGLFIQVSVGAYGSVYAAYTADQARKDPLITASAAALYGKLGRLPPTLSEAVVRYSAQRCAQLLEPMPRVRDEPLPGYRMRILDGNVLAGTHHRLTPLRRWLNACLPGKSLVVYEPGVGLVTDVVLCEDAYTQERALVTQLLPQVKANDVLIADRNFCTRKYVFGVHLRDAFVIVRQHKKNLPVTPLSPLTKSGSTDTCQVYEQRVQVTDDETGKTLVLRRIELRLFEKTRDGERTLSLVTNLPDRVSAQTIAEQYRVRWTIETHFQFLTQSLHCELPGLGKPQAALFGFAMALVAGNALAVVRGSIRAAHGNEADEQLSGYYLADEIGHDYRTLMKYLPPDQWTGWRQLAPADMSRLLLAVARHVNLKALKKSKRGPKKPPKEKPVFSKKHKHYSTCRLTKGLQPEEPC